MNPAFTMWGESVPPREAGPATAGVSDRLPNCFKCQPFCAAAERRAGA